MEKATKIKVAVTAFFAAINSLLGWRGVMALVWVAVMMLDYLSGTAAAIQGKEWSSGTARQGLWHKGGMIVVVLVAAIGDMVLTTVFANLNLGLAWPEALFPLVLTWYIITEMGSILENAVKMGAPVPSWMTSVLAAGKKAVENAGESALGGIHRE